MTLDPVNPQPGAAPDGEEVEELRRIYAEEFHETLTTEEAREMASRLLRFYEVLLDIADRMATLEKEDTGAIVKGDDASASSGRHNITNKD